MNALEIREVNFLGDTLIAAKDEKGVIWADVRRICEGLGLGECRIQNEQISIQRDTVLSQGKQYFYFPTKGEMQESLCLQLDYIPLWLAKIHITPSMIKKNPETPDKLLNYQLKAKDALTMAFTLPTKPLTQAEILAAQAQMLVDMERSQKEIKQSLADTNKRIDDISQRDYRRFIVIGSEEQEKKLDILAKKKGLSRADIILILQTLKLNPAVHSNCL